MKPQQANVAYCKKHRVFVNGLLEGRGWQEGDWCVFAGEYTTKRPQLVTQTSGLNEKYVYLHCSIVGQNDDNLVWIPTAEDVLGMLEEKGIEAVVIFKAPVSEGYFAGRSGPRQPTYYGETRLIALLELLRAVEGKG